MLGGAKPSVGFLIPVKVRRVLLLSSSLSEKTQTDPLFSSPASFHQACVKINDIAVARSSASDLLETMEPQETAELIHRHALGRTSSNPVNSNTYTVSIIRAEDLYSKSKSGKPACGFVAVHEGEERLIKTKTVLDQSAPRWEQGFETSGSGVKTLELSAMDRQPIGKHDVIGKAVSATSSRRVVVWDLELTELVASSFSSADLRPQPEILHRGSISRSLASSHSTRSSPRSNRNGGRSARRRILLHASCTTSSQR